MPSRLDKKPLNMNRLSNPSRFAATKNPARRAAARLMAATLLMMSTGSAVAWAQGTIGDGTASFRRIHFTPDFNNADYSVGGGLDHVFEDSWYFRVEGDDDETLFDSPDTQSYSGAVSSIAWSDFAARGLFDAEIVSTISEWDGGSSSYIRHDMTITNISPDPLQIHIFGYLDYDLSNSQFNDQAVLANDPDLIRVSDPDITCEFQGVGAVAFQVTDTQSGPLSLRDLMADGLVTNLDGSGLPFGPADWEGAYQWTASIAPASATTFTKIYSINRAIGDIFSDGFESGDTSAW